MANPYDTIRDGLEEAAALAAKEGRADYDRDREIAVLYSKVYVLVWKRLEELQPGAFEQPTGGQDVRG